jgi:hypothetical protein
VATSYRAPVEERRKLVAKPQPDIDRKALRDDINKRYENTLRYLGR